MPAPERRRGARAARLLLPLLGALLVTGVARAQQAAPPPLLVAGAGIFGLDGNEDQAAVLDLELRGRPMATTGVLRIEPVVGALATTHGTFYGRAGFARAFALSPRWDVTIVEAAGGYYRGTGKRLGSSVEFRSAIELGCRVRSDLRFGVTLAHLSNAGISEHNPGIESFTVTLGWLDPFAKRH